MKDGQLFHGLRGELALDRFHDADIPHVAQAQAQAQASSAYSQSIQQGVSALGNAASAFAPTKPS